MPGMMDTVLNLGLNDETVAGLVKISGDPRFAWDSYRRFLQMYGEVVLDIDHHHFEALLDDHKNDIGASLDTELSATDWQTIAAGFKDIVAQETGKPFPQDVGAQLWGAIGAVFGSWMNQRAITYRRLNNIPEDWGTAVSVQAMVFGNRGDDCATGVAFTRNPSTGANEFYGEFLVNAQGEDVVAGIRTPQSLTIAGRRVNSSKLPAMEEAMPAVFGELLAVRKKLEDRYRDMQDIEFTVERGRLWMLQTRTGKRTAQAALTIAVSLVEEGVIDRAEAIRRIEPNSLDQLLHPMLDPAAKTNVLARGLPASPGAASGKIVFSAEEAESCASRGEAVILARVEPRGHSRHARGPRHPHRAWRDDQPRRGRRPRHGAALRRRRRRYPDRLCGGYDDRAQRAAARRRSDNAQRLDRRDHPGRGADDRADAFRRFSDLDGLGRRAALAARARQCRDRDRRPRGAKFWRRGDRPVAHRAHVLRG
jgi:pyruvate,orthophosphate dikinase